MTIDILALARECGFEFYDDRASVVQMWRDAGVTCFQVAPGEF